MTDGLGSILFKQYRKRSKVFGLKSISEDQMFSSVANS